MVGATVALFPFDGHLDAARPLLAPVAWASRALAGHVSAHSILRDMRDWPQPSDHVPIVVSIER